MFYYRVDHTDHTRLEDIVTADDSHTAHSTSMIPAHFFTTTFTRILTVRTVLNLRAWAIDRSAARAMMLLVRHRNERVAKVSTIQTTVAGNIDYYIGTIASQ
jgi:hypothetical protein